MPERTLQPLLERLSGRGDRTAILQMTEDGTERLSYQALGSLVLRFAAGAEQAGVRPGDHIALFAAGGSRWVAACLGIIGAGAVPVPLDTQLDPKALRHILDRARVGWAFTDKERLDVLQGVGYQGEWLRFDTADEDPRSWARWLVEERDAPVARGPDDTALLFFTSGTTGPPKGVPLKHHHLAFQLRTIQEANFVRESDRVLQPLPPHHVYPLVVGTLAPLALGLPIVLPHAMLGPALVRALREGEVTLIVGVPRLFEALASGIESRLQEAPFPLRPLLSFGFRTSQWSRRRLGLRAGKWLLAPIHRRLAPALRVLASGGSELPEPLAWKLEGFGWRVAIGYGLTETSPLLTLNPPGTPCLGSVGRAVPGVELRIDHAAHPGGEQARSSRAEGEILARGESVFDGYLQNGPEEAEIFTEDGWFRTGDLGWMDERGYLFVTGRKNTLIVTSAGKNIRPEEVEAVYAEHPFIREIGICKAEGGLGAVIVPNREAIEAQGLPSVEYALRQAVTERAGRLPSYKRINRYVISFEPLARTRLGKIQRHVLRETYERLLISKDGGREPRPMALEEMREEDRRLLSNETARKVWELLARRYRGRDLGPDTSMRLDLGIDSLGWLDLSTEMAQRGAVLDEQRIARIDTVRDLLQAVSESPSGEGGVAATPLQDPESALNERQLRWLAPLPPPAAATAALLHGANRALMKGAFRLHVSGASLLERDAQFVFTPNHASFLDAFVVAAALPKAVRRRTFWGGWTGYALRNRLFRFGSWLARVVPIDPDQTVVSSLAFAAAVLSRGGHLVWFPEGERSLTGELSEFRPGLGLLLEQFKNVLVVPTVIHGAHEAWPRNEKYPRLRPISVRFTEPVSTEELVARGQGDDWRTRLTNGLHVLLAEELEGT